MATCECGKPTRKGEGMCDDCWLAKREKKVDPAAKLQDSEGELSVNITETLAVTDTACDHDHRAWDLSCSPGNPLPGYARVIVRKYEFGKEMPNVSFITNRKHLNALAELFARAATLASE